MKRWLILGVLFVAVSAQATPISERMDLLQKEGQQISAEIQQLQQQLAQKQQRLVEIVGALKELQTLEKKK